MTIIMAFILVLSGALTWLALSKIAVDGPNEDRVTGLMLGAATFLVTLNAFLEGYAHG